MRYNNGFYFHSLTTVTVQRLLFLYVLLNMVILVNYFSTSCTYFCIEEDSIKQRCLVLKDRSCNFITDAAGEEGPVSMPCQRIWRGELHMNEENRITRKSGNQQGLQR
ncbi:hypothetical protein Dimus_026406 [Dionaea muscipula]